MYLRRWCEILNSADHLAEKFRNVEGCYCINESEAEMIRDLYRFVLSMEYDEVKLQEVDLLERHKILNKTELAKALNDLIKGA